MNELKVLQDNPCLANKDKCGLMCCKIVAFNFPTKPRTDLKSLQLRPNADLIHYLTLHSGIKVRRGRKNAVVEFAPDLKQKAVQVGQNWQLVVFAPCKALSDEGNCVLYGQKGRPKICVEGYTTLKKGVLFVPNCIYTPDTDSIVLKEGDLA